MLFIRGNVFDLEALSKKLQIPSKSMVLAHCIASDFGMYGGIARQFVERYDMKNRLFEYAISENITPEWKSIQQPYIRVSRTREAGAIKCYTSLIGKAIKIDNVYNLVTKDLTSSLPTIQALKSALDNLRQQMLSNKEQYLIIPDMIGCGIDSLSRDDVIATIESVFQNTNIEVVAVKL